MFSEVRDNLLLGWQNSILIALPPCNERKNKGKMDLLCAAYCSTGPEDINAARQPPVRQGRPENSSNATWKKSSWFKRRDITTTEDSNLPTSPNNNQMYISITSASFLNQRVVRTLHVICPALSSHWPSLDPTKLRILTLLWSPLYLHRKMCGSVSPPQWHPCARDRWLKNPHEWARCLRFLTASSKAET